MTHYSIILADEGQIEESRVARTGINAQNSRDVIVACSGPAADVVPSAPAEEPPVPFMEPAPPPTPVEFLDLISLKKISLGSSCTCH